MKKIFTFTVAASLALSGCATTAGLTGSSANPNVSAEQKAEARQGAVRAGVKGCGLGVAMGALGSLFGGGLSVRSLAAGCVVGGATSGIQTYQAQLADFRALQGKVSVGAIATIKEKQVVIDGKPTPTAENLTLNLDADKVAARHADIQMVLSQLSATLNKQSMDMTVVVSGSAGDRAWLAEQLAALLKNPRVKVEGVAGNSPVIIVSPMPR